MPRRHDMMLCVIPVIECHLVVGRIDQAICDTKRRRSLLFVYKDMLAEISTCQKKRGCQKGHYQRPECDERKPKDDKTHNNDVEKYGCDTNNGVLIVPLLAEVPWNFDGRKHNEADAVSGQVADLVALIWLRGRNVVWRFVSMYVVNGDVVQTVHARRYTKKRRNPKFRNSIDCLCVRQGLMAGKVQR